MDRRESNSFARGARANRRPRELRLGPPHRSAGDARAGDQYPPAARWPLAHNMKLSTLQSGQAKRWNESTRTPSIIKTSASLVSLYVFIVVYLYSAVSYAACVGSVVGSINVMQWLLSVAALSMTHRASEGATGVSSTPNRYTQKRRTVWVRREKNINFQSLTKRRRGKIKIF